MMMPVCLALWLGSIAAPASPANPEEPVAPAPGDSVYTEEEVTGLLFGSPELGAELHGFVNLEYQALGFGSPAGPINTFDIHNVFLSTRARVGSDISLFVELEYEHGADVVLDRAFIDVTLAAPLTVRLGRFSSPLSYERIHYSPPVRLLVSRPMFVDVAFREWADTGLGAYGRLGRVGYNVSLVNGPRGLTEQGIPNLDVIDNNQNKTVIARVDVRAASFLELGLAGSAGTYDSQDLRWFYLAELDARLRRGPLDVWLEADYRDGQDEPCSAATAAACAPEWTGETAHRFGYSVLVAWVAVERVKAVHYLKPIVRFDELHDLAARTWRRRVTAGLNWSPVPHAVLKAELQVAFSSAGRVEGGAMASAVADF